MGRVRAALWVAAAVVTLVGSAVFGEPQKQAEDTSRKDAGKVAGAATEDFTVIILPDTQYYAEKYPETFYKQTQWIADNRDKENIKFVSHSGDIVENVGSTLEWQRASDAMQTLDGVVPYGLAAGNHDMEIDGSGATYNTYFPASRYRHYDHWGGSYLPRGGNPDIDNKNNYQLITAGGQDFVFVHMEFCPPDDVLSWADGVLREHKDRTAFITTHAILSGSGELHGTRPEEMACQEISEGDNTGLHIWQKLIIGGGHANVAGIFGGHVFSADGSGEARRTEQANGRDVVLSMSNYQLMENGGNGYLKKLRFLASEREVRVTTYSPLLDRTLDGPRHSFTFKY